MVTPTRAEPPSTLKDDLLEIRALKSYIYSKDLEIHRLERQIDKAEIQIEKVEKDIARKTK